MNWIEKLGLLILIILVSVDEPFAPLPMFVMGLVCYFAGHPIERWWFRE